MWRLADGWDCSLHPSHSASQVYSTIIIIIVIIFTRFSTAPSLFPVQQIPHSKDVLYIIVLLSRSEIIASKEQQDAVVCVVMNVCVGRVVRGEKLPSCSYCDGLLRE